MAAIGAEMVLPGVLELEEAGLQAWPGVETEYDGGWIRRAANGFTKRANSVQCLDPADGTNTVARVAASRAWLEQRGLPPVFRLTPLASPELIAALDAGGWRSIELSHVYAARLGAVAPDTRARATDPLDPAFLAAQARLQPYDGPTTDKFIALLKAMRVPARGVVVYAGNGDPAASALFARAGDIVVAGNVVTDPRQRRQGFGQAAMQTGLYWAQHAGATIAALNVAGDNLAAKALYQRLGFARQYDYTYRIVPNP
ncbi:GNAT family N-acetyltransferase [Devosia sp. 1566]|uniref:GNAT family N-acetyltransferase n=1 Tax=Devosia sp. 1566 TaxID=2499144 RepID=UPI0013E3A782|nr:GNAT family N-acetyltransferase [Devosia sp. 1566]